MKKFVKLLGLSLLMGCSQPIIHQGPEAPSQEYVVFISRQDLETLENEQAINLPLTVWDASKGIRVDLPAKIFVRRVLGTIAIFLPACDPPYRTPDNPTPNRREK